MNKSRDAPMQPKANCKKTSINVGGKR